LSCHTTPTPVTLICGGSACSQSVLSVGGREDDEQPDEEGAARHVSLAAARPEHRRLAIGT
jgi:hypothetical protein